MVLYPKEILTDSSARSAYFCFNYFRGRCEDQSNIYRMSAALGRWARATRNVSAQSRPCATYLLESDGLDEKRTVEEFEGDL